MYICIGSVIHRPRIRYAARRDRIEMMQGREIYIYIYMYVRFFSPFSGKSEFIQRKFGNAAVGNYDSRFSRSY